MPLPDRPNEPAAKQPSLGACADGMAWANGQSRAALQLAVQQLSEAQAGGAPAALCHAHTELARALAALHAYSPAESHLASAARWAVVMGAIDVRAELACAMAEVASNATDLAQASDDESEAGRQHLRATRGRARDHALEAARLASLTTDPHWEVRVLLRASDVLDRCGDHGDAVQVQHRALVLMGLNNTDLPTDADPAFDRPSHPLQLQAPAALM